MVRVLDIPLLRTIALSGQVIVKPTPLAHISLTISNRDNILTRGDSDDRPVQELLRQAYTAIKIPRHPWVPAHQRQRCVPHDAPICTGDALTQAYPSQWGSGSFRRRPSQVRVNVLTETMSREQKWCVNADCCKLGWVRSSYKGCVGQRENRRDVSRGCTRSSHNGGGPHRSALYDREP
jgi:hypothetical protein